MSLPEWFRKSCQRIEPVGSRVTCLPAPVDTDQDYLCLPHPKTSVEALIDLLVVEGWECEGEYGESGGFSSIRKDEDNLIISHSEEHFTNFMRATFYCKEKNVLDKQERIRIFNLIMKPKKKTMTVGLVTGWVTFDALMAANPIIHWENNPFANNA